MSTTPSICSPILKLLKEDKNCDTFQSGTDSEFDSRIDKSRSFLDDSPENVMALLEQGDAAKYVDEQGRGILYLLMVEYALLARKHYKVLNKRRWEDLYTITKLVLQRGASPLQCYMIKHKIDSHKTYSSTLDILIRLKGGEIYEGKYKEIVLEYFILLMEFGAGLLRKERRFSVLTSVEEPAEGFRTYNTERISKALAIYAKDDINLSQNTFPADVENKDIIMALEVGDKRRVWIYSLKELENILNGTNKTIIIPNLKQIARNVFEADPLDLADGVRALFEKYLKELDDKPHPRTYYEKRYSEFKKIIATMPVTMGKCYYDFAKKENDKDSRLVRDDIRRYSPWVKHNVADVLILLAKCNAELSFFGLAKNHYAALGREDF